MDFRSTLIRVLLLRLNTCLKKVAEFLILYVMEGDQGNSSAMDLDLNQEPADGPFGSALGLGSLLNELESAHVRIEDRIRQLEAVTARSRHRQRWRQLRNSFETSEMIEPLLRNVDLDRGSQWHDGIGEGSGGGSRREHNVEKGKGCKRDSSHLVAKALEIDSEAKRKHPKDSGSFFDCNICLNIAKEPILTCCGHLFCWLCFYKLPFAYSTSKECPVCNGEVKDSTIVPIYGNGDSSKELKKDSSMKDLVPPRPKAQRIESVRQQGVSHIPVTEVLRRIRTSIGAIYITPEQEAAGNADLPNHQGSTSQEVPNVVESSSVRLRRRLRGQFTRVLSESAASLSSISSALNSAERLVEDLDTYINNRIPSVDGDLLTRDAATSTVPVVESFSSRTNYTSDNFQQMEQQTPGSVDEHSVSRATSSSSSSRRYLTAGLIDMRDGTSHETGSRRIL